MTTEEWLRRVDEKAKSSEQKSFAAAMAAGTWAGSADDTDRLSHELAKLGLLNRNFVETSTEPLEWTVRFSPR